jgi:two-component system, OmpR family, phosphate regulon sensor histidine kinase PhoR
LKAYFCFMNKWTTSLIIALVTVSTIGLMIIQVYWIRDAVKVKQAVFFRDVNQAMLKVVYELDQLRLQDRVIKQRKAYQHNKSIYDSFDSLNRLLIMSMGNLSSPTEFDRFIRNTNLANKALQELSFNYTEQDPGGFLYKKKELIDSLISRELRKKRISTAYEFGIYSPATNSMIVQKTGVYPEELLNESYYFNLAPLGSLYSFPNKLLIYFPNEQSFIVRQLWKLLLVSVVLFIVIIVSFSFSMFIIFRQKRLSEMKNDFINNMTHEFKTPISTIALACEALKDKDVQKSDLVYNNYVGVISEENSRLGSMAEQILQTAVLDKGQLKLKKTQIDMHEIIRQAANSKLIAAGEKGGAIDLQLKATKSELNGDPVHLTNVIVNLIDNALKYNLNKPHILINTINNNHSLLIRVQDNGIGISKSNQRKIFDKLYRVPTGNVHDFKGFGLGLNYVKAAAELHDGTVSVDSEPGQGSTFTIKLPYN